MKNKYLILALICMLPMIMGCDKSDDITQIFLGKTWKFTYIAKDLGKTWYSFKDVTNDNLQEYTGKTKTLSLSLSGMQSGNSINGTFSTSGSLSATGKWQADGESRDFKTQDCSGTASDEADVIAQKILYGLSNVKAYEGDTSNLRLYFDYEGVTLFLAFIANN